MKMRSSSYAASRAACFPPRTAPGRRAWPRCSRRRTVFPVHRLDRRRARRVVFAKTREAAAFLSAHLTAGKEYLALAEGAPCKEPEELYDLLFHDRARNKTYVVRRTRAGVREARLICTPLRLLPDGRAALHLQLLTGRTHQIRVQLGSRGCPVCGDRKYGAQAGAGRHRPLCLAAARARTRTGAASRSACRRSCCRMSCGNFRFSLQNPCKIRGFLL